MKLKGKLMLKVFEAFIIALVTYALVVIFGVTNILTVIMIDALLSVVLGSLLPW